MAQRKEVDIRLFGFAVTDWSILIVGLAVSGLLIVLL